MLQYDSSIRIITEAKKQLEILLVEKDLQNQKLIRDNNNMKRILSSNDIRNNQNLKRALLEKLSSTFSEAQIDYLLQLKKRVNWSEDDITKAITLRSISKKSYNYLRKHLGIPLPGESTLRDWTRNINCEPGIQRSSLKVMQEKGKEMTMRDKACMLVFDEMSLKEQFCYDRRTDRAYGCHSKVQVAMAVGLIGPSWRQPIYYDYDVNMSTTLMYSLITALEEAGYPVYAVNCDLGGSNHGLLGDLGLGWDDNGKSHFVNPYDRTRNVNFLCDIPHLIKLVRNNLLDHCIKTPSGVASKEPLQELVNYEQGVFKQSYKINEKHITVAGSERQKVKTAVHLLSKTVGQLLSCLKGRVNTH